MDSFHHHARHPMGEIEQTQPSSCTDAAHQAESIRRLVGQLERDQRARWQAGERVLVEIYLKEHPALQSQPDRIVDLLYNEFLLRETAGEKPRPEEYLTRFPDLTNLLLDQFEVHGALRSPPEPNAATGQEPTIFSPSADAASVPGTMELPAIPGYEVIKELGRGGMGVVYLAWQQDLNRLVALKMILTGALAGAGELARFRTEAEAGARLQHPHIVQIYEVSRHDQRPYIALEYVEGGSLAQKLDGTPFPARQAVELLHVVSRAVHYAHQRGIVHRDLKPGNVLLTADGMPKITDFGLAKIRVGGGEAHTRSGAVVGTPSYIAPEMAGGKARDAGPAVDVYALGAILYELLTGRPPFKAETPLETLLQVQTVEPVAPSRLQPKLSRDLATITLKCLEKEPTKRYASAEALAEDLRRFLAGEPIQARRAGNIERSWRWSRRHPAAAALVATLLLSLIGGTTGVIGYIQYRAERQATTAARKARIERQVEVALQEARTLGERAWTLTETPPLWGSTLSLALAAVARAEAVVTEAEQLVDQDLLDRVSGIKSELRAAEQDRLMVDALDQIRLQQNWVHGRDRYSTQEAAAKPKYLEAFRKYGLELGAMPLEKAVDLIRAKREPVRSALVSALDDWVWWEPARSEQSEWLRKVIAGADQDKWRQKLRQALEHPHPESLDRLADDEESGRQPATALCLLGKTLLRQGVHASAIRVLRRAQDRFPGDFWINEELALALPHPQEAITYHRIALALRPRSFGVHNNLGGALRAAGDLAGAIAAFRKAIDLNPRDAGAHNNLGVALLDTGRPDVLAEAMAALQKAMTLDPKFAPAYANLGNALRRKQDLAGAITEYQKAIQLDPEYVVAHNNLGVALHQQGDLPAAIAAYRQAISIDCSYARAYQHLGIALKDQYDLPEAIAAYRMAIELDPDYAPAYANLGSALRYHAEFTDSLAAFKRCHELGSRIWRPSESAQWVKEAAQLVELNAKWPAVRISKLAPADAAQKIRYAQISAYKRFFAAGAQFYEEAFAQQPALLEDRSDENNRYDAACVAALAGTGQGEDANHLTPAQRARLRKLALDWLRSELAAQAKLLTGGRPPERTSAEKDLRIRWQQNPLLKEVRDQAALDKLPPAEREAWQKLWLEVGTLLEKTSTVQP
jgi:serine/threonine-protein kinase